MPGEGKPKVVIDTNVFVSGLTFNGKPREILDLAWKEEIEVYISSFVLEELSDSLKEDFGWSKDEIMRVIKRIRTKTILIHPKTSLSVIKEKRDDNRILECAVEGKVDYLISGDKKHLLPLKKYQGVRILSPAEFLNLF